MKNLLLTTLLVGGTLLSNGQKKEESGSETMIKPKAKVNATSSPARKKVVTAGTPQSRVSASEGATGSRTKTTKGQQPKKNGNSQENNAGLEKITPIKESEKSPSEKK